MKVEQTFLLTFIFSLY